MKQGEPLRVVDCELALLHGARRTFGKQFVDEQNSLCLQMHLNMSVEWPEVCSTLVHRKYMCFVM